MTEYTILLENYRGILENVRDGSEALKAIAGRLSSDLPISLIIADNEGYVRAEERLEHFNPFDREVEQRLDNVLAESLGDMQEDLINLSMDELPLRTAPKSTLGDYMASVFVLKPYGVRSGSLIVYRCGELESEDIAFCKYICALVGLIMGAIESRNRLAAEQKKEAVRAVTESLSYSELMVSAIIFRRLQEGEGIIVASRIADEEGITRSIIVNAIRKLESAGILESRSLGMKGTYIKILNEYFRTEVSKIKNTEKAIENSGEN